jgi:hypothetical protein
MHHHHTTLIDLKNNDEHKDDVEGGWESAWRLASQEEKSKYGKTDNHCHDRWMWCLLNQI